MVLLKKKLASSLPTNKENKVSLPNFRPFKNCHLIGPKFTGYCHRLIKKRFITDGSFTDVSSRELA
jgi:hypothetical protein